MSYDDILNFCKTNKDINSICKENKDYILRNYIKRNYNIDYPIKNSTFEFIRNVNPHEWKLHKHNGLIPLVMEGKVEKLTELIQIFYKLKTLGTVEEDENEQNFNSKEEITRYLLNNFFGYKQTLKDYVYNLIKNMYGMYSNTDYEITTTFEEDEQTFINNVLVQYRKDKLYLDTKQKEAFEQINNVYNRYKQQTKIETLENIQKRIDDEQRLDEEENEVNFFYFDFFNFKLDIDNKLIDLKNLKRYGDGGSIKINDILIMFGSLDLIKTFFQQFNKSVKMIALFRGDIDIIDFVVDNINDFESKSYLRRIGIKENIIDELDRKFGLPF